MHSETARIETFSDAVFAIAITLLILDVKIPARHEHLAAALLEQWPSYLAFFLSFAYIGIMWINHHRIFTCIQHANDVLLLLNLFVLLGVTIVPFPTAVLAEHMRGPDQRMAGLLYNAVFVLVTLAFRMLWRYAISRRLVAQNAVPNVLNPSGRYAIAPLLYLGCLAIACFSIRASLIANVVIAVFFALPPSLVRARLSRA
jgi:TMEM175 potassium channel family protein